MAEDDIEVKKIATDGDIVLVVGKPASVKLLVSSATLKSKSKVFEALLSSRWQEGQDIGTSSPKAIELPEDRAEAMFDMCNLLHGQRIVESPEETFTTQIFQLSVLIDKYGCAEALHYQSQGILLISLDGGRRLPMAALFRLATASDLLNQPRAFRIVTRILIKATWEDYTTMLQEEFAKFLPIAVFLAIEKTRSAAYYKICADLPLLGMPICNDLSHDELYGSESVNYDPLYMDQLCDAFEIPCWPPRFLEIKCSIREAVHRVRSIGIGRLKGPTCGHTGLQEEVGAGDFKQFTDEVDIICEGLCLQCVRRGNTSLFTICEDEAHEQRVFG